MRPTPLDRRGLVLGGIAAGLALTGLVLLSGSSAGRTELNFENKHEYLNGFVWSPPYPGAGPETPEWVKTPASVGQDATSSRDEQHREFNVLGNDYQYPDYARRTRGTRSTKLWMKPQHNPTSLWVGSPDKFLPPNGDYPGGSTGIPEDGYLAFETGWGENPYHGELIAMQEAGIAGGNAISQRQMYRPVVLVGRRGQTLSIMDPGSLPAPFDDWTVGNSRADLDRSFDPAAWGDPNTQPLDKYNFGKFSCTIGEDCHDRTHQGGLLDNVNQMYDTYPMGSIDRNSPKSSHAEYAQRNRLMPKLALPYRVRRQ